MLREQQTILPLAAVTSVPLEVITPGEVDTTVTKFLAETGDRLHRGLSSCGSVAALFAWEHRASLALAEELGYLNVYTCTLSLVTRTSVLDIFFAMRAFDL